MSRGIGWAALVPALLCAGPGHAARPRPTKDPLVLAVRAGDRAKVARLLTRENLESGWR